MEGTACAEARGRVSTTEMARVEKRRLIGSRKILRSNQYD